MVQVLAYARSLRVRYPNMMHDLLRRNVETGERVTLLPDGFWLPVARGMRLGAAQVGGGAGARDAGICAHVCDVSHHRRA